MRWTHQVLNLGVHNRCLLSKWLFKLINEDGLWKKLLRRKYLRDKTITQVQYMLGDSYFWVGLMMVKRDFLRFGKFNLGDGSQVRFWEDVWMGARSLKDCFPSLYSIVRKKNTIVKSVLSSAPFNVAFKRSLVGVNLQAWHVIVAMVMNDQLTNQREILVCDLHQNGRYSVHLIYTTLMTSLVLLCNMQIWKLKLPLKIKFFTCYLFK